MPVIKEGADLLNAIGEISKFCHANTEAVFIATNDAPDPANGSVGQPLQRKGTIEYLFKDYSGESFKTELVNPLKSVGQEQW